MVETQTRVPSVETLQPQPIAETDTPHIEPFNDESRREWHRTLATTGAYINHFSSYEDRILKARTRGDQDEMRKLRSEFVATVESPILAFTRAYAISEDRPTFEGALEAIVGLLPRLPSKSRNTLILSELERASAIMRIENFCRLHEVNFSTATDPSEIAQDVDIYINGKAVRVERANRRTIHPNQSAASVYTPRLTRKGTLLDQAGDEYMTLLLNKVATAPTKKNAQPQKSQVTRVTKSAPTPKSKTTNIPSKERTITDRGLRIAPIIAAKAVGLSLNENEPPYLYKQDMLNTTPEALTTQIIDDALGDDEMVDFYKIDTKEFGMRVAASIALDRDSDLVVALKHYAAQACGIWTDGESGGVSKEIVASAEGKLSQAGLRDALTYLYEVSHKTEASLSNYVIGKMGQINGRRVEVSTQHLLTAMGYQVQEASRRQDDMGIDIFIDGVPFDVKSTEHDASRSANKEISRSKQQAYYPSVRLVPPFTSESFEGQVIVPNNVIKRLAEDESLRKKIDTSIANYRAQFGSRIDFDSTQVTTDDDAYRPAHLDTDN